jgi:hypothetical protein
VAYNITAETKTINERHNTKGGETNRLETWQDAKTGKAVRYTMAYINYKLCPQDNGRVLGFENSHMYSGFSSRHHYHWFGRVFENKKFVSYDATLLRFQRFLKPRRYNYKKDY